MFFISRITIPFDFFDIFCTHELFDSDGKLERMVQFKFLHYSWMHVLSRIFCSICFCILHSGQPAFIYWSFAFMTSIQRVNGSDRYIFYRQPFNQFDFPFKFTRQQTKTKCQWAIGGVKFQHSFCILKHNTYRKRMIKIQREDH